MDLATTWVGLGYDEGRGIKRTRITRIEPNVVYLFSLFMASKLSLKRYAIPRAALPVNISSCVMSST